MMLWAAFRLLSMAPLGAPVVPPVYWTYPRSSGVSFTPGESVECLPRTSRWKSRTVFPARGVTFPDGTFLVSFPSTRFSLGRNPATLVVITTASSGISGAIFAICSGECGVERDESESSLPPARSLI